MANIMENRVSTTFTQEELTKLSDQQEALMAILEPKTVALTDDELTSLSSMAVDNFVFVQEAVNATDPKGASMLPPSTAAMVTELHTDVAFFQQLAVQEAVLNDLLNRIRHTKRLVAHESYKVANSMYKKFQGLAEDGVPGAKSRYDSLKERYKDNGPGREAETKL